CTASGPGPLAVHVQLDPVTAGGNVRTGFLELGEHRLEGGRIGVLELDMAAGDGGGHQVGAGFDAVRHHAVAGTVEALDAVDDDGVGTGTLDLRAHGDQ